MSLTKGVMDFNRRISQMNEACGTNAPPLSDRDFRPATNISDKTTDCVSRFLRVTGQEAFLYDVAPGVKAPDGMETEHGVFVRNTESKYLPFTLLSPTAA